MLGTQFTLTGRCSAELRLRISAAWGKFHALWPVLGKRDGNLNKRLWIFDSTVTQTALWCCESWLITQCEKQLLKAVQHAMLRRIAGARRFPSEDWLEWMKRSTRKALSLAKNCGIRMWCETHLRNKWTWAGHISRMAQGRLARRAMEWRGAEWQQSELHLPARLRIRRVARTHWFRWEDELRRYGTSCNWQSWQQLSQDREAFASHANAFVAFAMR